MDWFGSQKKTEATLFTPQRHAMVEKQLMRRGIRNEAVLEALGKVPRHLFVPAANRHEAYDDTPVPIGHAQTISQPYIVASMTEEARIKPDHRVLEIGTGCGYQTAVLAEIASEVFTIEIIAELHHIATDQLRSLGYTNVTTRLADGSLGWPEHAPFDAIIVTAAAPVEPSILAEQLKPGGCMIYPLDRERHDYQDLIRLRRTKDGYEQESLYSVRFVPMQGSIRNIPE